MIGGMKKWHAGRKRRLENDEERCHCPTSHDDGALRELQGARRIPEKDAQGPPGTSETVHKEVLNEWHQEFYICPWFMVQAGKGENSRPEGE